MKGLLHITGESEGETLGLLQSILKKKRNRILMLNVVTFLDLYISSL